MGQFGGARADLPLQFGGRLFQRLLRPWRCPISWCSSALASAKVRVRSVTRASRPSLASRGAVMASSRACIAVRERILEYGHFRDAGR
jgi:hypothetical protein